MRGVQVEVVGGGAGDKSASPIARGRVGAAAKRRILGPLVGGWLALLQGCYVGLDGADPGSQPDADAGAGSSADSGSSSELPEPAELAYNPIRRLTQAQYANTIRDLLRLEETPSFDLAIDEGEAGFLSNATDPLTLGGVEKYQLAAEIAAGLAMKQLPQLLACSQQPQPEDTCADAFIEDFGKRAYRRPLSAIEGTRYRALYDAHRPEKTFTETLGVLVEAMLQSPNFVYRLEGGSDDSDEPQALDGYEMASRLSYMLWNSMPDDDLFAAADADRLQSDADIEDAVERMLADPRAKAGISSFHTQWLGVQALASRQSNDPAFTPELRAAMLEEFERFTDFVVRGDGDGRVATLLAAPWSLVSGPLYDVYGLPEGGDDWAGVDLPTTERAGVLTMPAFLASHSHPNELRSPIFQGLTILGKLLCTEVPEPPDDVEVEDEPVGPVPEQTPREWLAVHRENPACAGCHNPIDGLGLPYASYDGLGRYRTDFHGLPLDPSGEIIGSGEETDGPVSGPVDLALKLSESSSVRACITRQWFRYALGREETLLDEEALQDLAQSFSESGDIRKLVIELAKSKPFRFQGQAIDP